LSFTLAQYWGYALAAQELPLQESLCIIRRLRHLEDAMKLSVVLLTLAFMGVAFGGQTTPANDKKEATADAKKARWQGHIVRINKDNSSLSVRGGQKNMESMERQIFYDSSTVWTKQGKPADQSEFKEGSFVIVLGHPDDKGVFRATRIDLRTPR
jgi:Domain of unknown function (DUF5666)